MNPRGRIHIFGLGFKPLRPEERQLLRNLERIFLFEGALRKLSKEPLYATLLEEIRSKLIPVRTKEELLCQIERSFEESACRELGVLATGDPLVFGIGEELRRTFPQRELLIYPDLSSLQVFCARLMIPFTEVRALSFHGRSFSEEALLKAIEGNLYVAIFTDAKNSPEKLIQVLYERGFRGLRIYVGECLGSQQEMIHQGFPEELLGKIFREPNLILIENPNWGRFPLMGRGAEEFRHHEGLITKDEVRGVVLHKLAPPRRGVIWDIGAGSGSVSIELANLSEHLEVFAIERDPELVKLIEVNRREFCVPNLRVIPGEAPFILEGLPRPDRVFLGGSGGRLNEILEYLSKRARPEILVATFVVFEHLHFAMTYLRSEARVELSQIQVSRSKPLGQNLYLKAENPIFILRAHFHPEACDS